MLEIRQRAELHYHAKRQPHVLRQLGGLETIPTTSQRAPDSARQSHFPHVTSNFSRCSAVCSSVSSNYAAYCSILAKKRRVSPTQIVGAPDERSETTGRDEASGRELSSCHSAVVADDAA